MDSIWNFVDPLQFSFSLSWRTLPACKLAVIRKNETITLGWVAGQKTPGTYIGSVGTTEKLPIYVGAVFCRSSWSWILNLKLRWIRHTKLLLTFVFFSRLVRFKGWNEHKYHSSHRRLLILFCLLFSMRSRPSEKIKSTNKMTWQRYSEK